MTCDEVTTDEAVDERGDLSFRDVVRARRSVRGFHPTPVPDHVLEDVLADAQLSPSNCNTQPWNIHLVSGDSREALSAALLDAGLAGKFSLDFTFDTNAFYGRYRERSRAQGAGYYRALGVSREDIEGRREASRRNLRFYGAPHVAMLFLPTFGDSVRVASDVGMYAQTFMLALAARGLASVPQTILGYYADTVRDVLGVSAEMKLLFGISFGYADEAALSYSYDVGRVPVSESATFHR